MHERPNLFFEAPQLRFMSAQNIFHERSKVKIIITPNVLDNLHECPKIGLSNFVLKSTFSQAPQKGFPD